MSGSLLHRDPRRRAAGQTVEPVHLGAARRQQRLFARPAGHRPGAQIRTKGQVPNTAGWPGAMALT
jgi:hypothetical protein